MFVLTHSNIPREKNKCMEINTIETPIAKFNVMGWPNNNALNNPVSIVAIVEEYFFKIVSANLKKKLDKIP